MTGWRVPTSGLPRRHHHRNRPPRLRWRRRRAAAGSRAEAARRYRGSAAAGTGLAPWGGSAWAGTGPCPLHPIPPGPCPSPPRPPARSIPADGAGSAPRAPRGRARPRTAPRGPAAGRWQVAPASSFSALLPAGHTWLPPPAPGCGQRGGGGRRAWMCWVDWGQPWCHQPWCHPPWWRCQLGHGVARLLPPRRGWAGGLCPHSALLGL